MSSHTQYSSEWWGEKIACGIMTVVGIIGCLLVLDLLTVRNYFAVFFALMAISSSVEGARNA